MKCIKQIASADSKVGRYRGWGYNDLQIAPWKDVI